MTKIMAVVNTVTDEVMRDAKLAKMREAETEMAIREMMKKADKLASIVMEMKNLIDLTEKPLIKILHLITGDVDVQLEEAQAILSQIEEVTDNVRDLFGDEDESVEEPESATDGQDIQIYGGEQATVENSSVYSVVDAFNALLFNSEIANAQRQRTGFVTR